MAVINTNVKALFSQAALTTSGRSQALAMQQLSTGKRINSARDDAAGMAIATRMTQQIRGLNQAVRNAGDAINLIQTAEGATNEITDMMQRMRELAVQAVNDTNDNAQRSYLDLEFQQLKQQIVQISDNTEWNGFPVLNGTAGQRVGEMPVYKVTSKNQLSSVFINPTTAKNVTAGEQQSVSLDITHATANGTYSLDFGKLGHVDVAYDHTATQAQFNAAVTAALQSSGIFSPYSGRTLNIDGSNNLTMVFAPDDGNVSTANVTAPAGFSNTVTSQNLTPLATEAFTATDGKFLVGGKLQMSVVSGSNTIKSTFTQSDGTTIPLTGSYDPTTTKVTFYKTNGMNSQVISSDLSYTLSGVATSATNKQSLSLNVDVLGSLPTMQSGDLVINGTIIGPSLASYDKLSPANNAAGSAIAKAAAINKLAVAQGQTVGESQSITFSGPVLPGIVDVGGVKVDVSGDTTPEQVAKTVALALQTSPQFNSSTGRVISYAEGSAVVNISYPVSDGNVPQIQVLPGQTAITGLVNVTQNFAQQGTGTGVFAKVNANIYTGQAMVAGPQVKGNIYINGYASADIATVLNNPQATRADVVSAINFISDRTGVKAVDTGSDQKGITLTAVDGRNIEVQFKTNIDSTTFGKTIGLREGVQSSTISLESKIHNPVVISTNTGNVSNAGLDVGNYTKNQAVLNTQQRASVLPAQAQVEKIDFVGSLAGSANIDQKATLTINGNAFAVNVVAAATAATFSINGVTVSPPSGVVTTLPQTPQNVRDALVGLVNSYDSSMGVFASAGNNPGQMLITAKNPGTPYTWSVTSSSGSGLTPTSQELAPNIAAQTKSLSKNDLVINGVTIRQSLASDDIYSNKLVSSSDPASSAIALAAAINASSSQTGVKALANPVVSAGQVIDTTVSGPQTLWVNGKPITINLIGQDADARRNSIANVLNNETGNTGVKADNNGKGITLTTIDGRNLSVWFDSSVKGLCAASFGLDKGLNDATAQVSTIQFGTASTTLAASTTASIMINGVKFSASANTTEAGLAAALFNQIQTTGSPVTDNLDIGYVPGSSTITVSAKSLAKDANSNALVNPSTFDIRGAARTDTGGTLTISTTTPANTGSNDVTGVNMSAAYTNNVLGGIPTLPNVKTVYGTVKLVADAPVLPTMPATDGLTPSSIGADGNPIVITSGTDGIGPNSNFSALGFNEGSFGGRASEDMAPPRVGRLEFQVGSSANQVVSIDLADFGKGGDITGEITGDIDQTVENRTVRINTRDGATAVLKMLDISMDKVNATRATMGAVMNRLDHVINNLTNVSMNLSTSRSGIEDADYASSSTELAKTQIMQQAATAVLAQANTSQQTVLKLLGG